MSFLWSILLVLISAVLQCVLPAVGRLSFTHLPLVSVVVVYGMLALDFRCAVFLALFAGFVKDSLDIGPVGGWMFAFLVITLIFNRYREQVFAGEVATQALFGCVGCGSASLIYGLVGLLARAPYFPLLRVATASLLAGAFGLVLVPLCAVFVFEPMARKRRLKRRAF
ncbi:hypothetical protein ACFLQY_02555 [Verrucomicrobiota bacterium]